MIEDREHLIERFALVALGAVRWVKPDAQTISVPSGKKPRSRAAFRTRRTALGARKLA
jgi:hypothetical protein